MLIPRPAVIQWRKTASTQARQLNMNNAARAPPWRSPKAMLLVQLIFCRSVLSRRSVLTNASRDSSLQRFRHSLIVVLSACVFMARVAPLRKYDEPSHSDETWARESLRVNPSPDISASKITALRLWPVRKRVVRFGTRGFGVRESSSRCAVALIVC
ncbi:MAG: hypothetical protein JWP08_498 [Bryobacterales bacterium]|nr:hypothetical protein [Bryobacterales bacterium]